MEDRLPRKLAAILYADVAGYSRLMGEDEDATHRTLSEFLDSVSATVESNRGQVMHYAGDAMLAQFSAVLDALSCAIAIQNELRTRNAELPDERKVQFRIGVNLGDVIEDRGDIYGDGVNVAARLETLAEPGGVCISDAVRTAISNTLPFQYVSIGEHQVKNIAEPVRAYQVFNGDRIAATPGTAIAAPDASSLNFHLPERPSVAILPFKSLGFDSDQDYLADGIRLGIQATLVQLSGLFLVNVPVLNTYRERDVSSTSAGAELGVRYVLEGAVQQAGKSIRATVQLTDVDTKQTIWAERYDRVLDDVFKLQDEITGEVISALSVKLIDSERGRVWFGTLTSPEAREYYYRGSSHLYELNKENNAAARHMFEELYRVQPDSVLGPSNVSVTHWVDAFFSWTDSSAGSIEQASTWAQKAMEYEDNNGIGHAVFGHLQLLDGKYDEALATCSKGVELRSSCPMARGLLGLVLNYCGDAEAAVKSVREAIRLERIYPAWMINILAAAYRDCGEIELSIPAARESVRLDPQSNDARLILCSDYNLAADHEHARRIADEIIASDPAFRLSTYAESQPYKNPAPLERVIGALREAGLPD
jgi:class 3 adenylate cyclase/tetratricopeptide (TPR) repeat protein